ncbi:hypothetical protein L1987_18272 [Smallanthus sonchifolius]|uniref:Uncharacterized protein n=1 Tax=Smallanthus sonchifolius TaxID=185202 RepID=A0ACB9J0A6_9ASTR|nr:hypothetical protein L1987_18272 [Smallanthus sonchifolius]
MAGGVWWGVAATGGGGWLAANVGGGGGGGKASNATGRRVVVVVGRGGVSGAAAVGGGVLREAAAAGERWRGSKWAVAVTLGGFIALRRDELALWAAMGSVSNFVLSITLKRILKQERPVSKVRSSPGMPSSHAQTTFFTLVFIGHGYGFY